MTSYVIVLLLLGLLALVHEAGHLAAARVAGIPVAAFSVGFGPVLWKRERGGTEYRLSLVPLGGYVLPRIDGLEGYVRIPARRRILLALGGPAANLLLAPLLLAPAVLIESGFSMAGLLLAPIAETSRILRETLAVLPALFTEPARLSGVVGIVAQGGEIVSGGAARALHLAAWLSVSFAVLNLLPVPALDGGKIVLCVLEKIHPALTRLHVPMSIAGWVLILGLMVYVTVMDVGRLLA